MTEENIRKFAAEEEGANCNSRDDSTVNNWPEEEEEEGSLGEDFHCRSRYDVWSFCELDSWHRPGNEGNDVEAPFGVDLKDTLGDDPEVKIGSEEDEDEEEADEDEDGDDAMETRDLESEISAKPGTSANSRKDSRGVRTSILAQSLLLHFWCS